MEGPSLVILREELQPFLGQRVLKSTGNTKQAKGKLKGRVLARIETWGKVLFLIFSDPKNKLDPIVTKTHFLMFGSYRIDDPKPGRVPRLELRFKNGVLYLYSCSFLLDAEKYLENVDRSLDIMSKSWKLKHVLQQMKRKQALALCDLLLDQEIFAGSGNIIKNEVLFNLRCHPLTTLSAVKESEWPKVARAVRKYGAQFYAWKKIFQLRKHWQVYRKGSCPICGTKITREKTGRLLRGSFYCSRCQPKRKIIRSLKVHPVLAVAPKSKVRESRLDH